MAGKNKQSHLTNALEAAPDAFLDTLKENLESCRKMIWSIIETKRFDGFHDAESLINAYDHIDKTIKLFSKVQLPLPGMSETEQEAYELAHPLLPLEES